MPVRYELATPADDPELRRLLRESPFAGSISLSFEREPNYFLASAIEGPFHETLLVRDAQTSQILGIGDRSVRPLYVNGSPTDVGYFSGLRVNPDYQHGLALARFLGKGFEGQRERHKDGRAKFYLISVVSDNNPARRLLDSHLAHYPRLHHHTRMSTYAIHPARPKGLPQLPVTRGRPDLLPALLDCLVRNGQRLQFAPCWTKNTLFSDLTPGLRLEDFFLVLDGTRVRGCLALWDQQSCKQSVIRGYAGSIARFRKLLNLLAPLGGWPIFPDPGTRLNHCFACFLAVDDDDPDVFTALLRALYNEAARRKYAYFMLGLAQGRPFHQTVKSYLPIPYQSDIYLAAWQDGYDAVAGVDGRPCGLEIALL